MIGYLRSFEVGIGIENTKEIPLFFTLPDQSESSGDSQVKVENILNIRDHELYKHKIVVMLPDDRSWF